MAVITVDFSLNFSPCFIHFENVGTTQQSVDKVSMHCMCSVHHCTLDKWTLFDNSKNKSIKKFPELNDTNA